MSRHQPAHALPAPPPIVLTGFDITDAMHDYLVLGHKIDVDHKYALDDEKVREHDRASDPRVLAAQRQHAMVKSCLKHFRWIRAVAPEEVRRGLEVPFCELFQTTGGSRFSTDSQI